MDEALNGGFNDEKRRAVERMREMSSRSKYRQSTRAGCSSIGKDENAARRHDPGPSFLSGTGKPFLSNPGADSDISLILGLALILMSESSDRLLLLALLYILL